MRARIACPVTVLAVLAIAAPAASATTFTVTSTGDQSDANSSPNGGDRVCDVDLGTTGNQCTLRAAIEQGNADPGGAPHRIRFSSGVQGSTISVGATPLPDIAVPGTPVSPDGQASIDGCSDGFGENTTATQPCVGLRSTTGGGTGLRVEYASPPAPLSMGVWIRGLAFSNFDTGIQTVEAGTVVRNNDFGVKLDGTTVEGMTNGVLVGTTSGARIGGSSASDRNVFAGNGHGVKIWGGDGTAVQGNWFGVLRDGLTEGANGRAITVTSVTLGGDIVEPANNNLIGGASDAAFEGSACVSECNLIANSTIAGIDLKGVPSSGASDGPSVETTVFGNWVGLNAAGAAAGNEKAIVVGDADPWIGLPERSYGNLISANNGGVDQTGGKGFMTLEGNVFGLTPDHETGLPNTGTNAVIGGDAGTKALVQGNLFGATARGLVLTGTAPDVIGNFFTPPSGTGTYSEAALVIEPGAGGARIGSDISGGANAFGGVDTGKPAIWILGADGVRIVNNSIGTIPFAAPLAGPPIRIEDGPGANPATGAQIGGEGEALRNSLTRAGGPAIEVGGSATGIEVQENEGIATGSFNDPGSLFTDLLPAPGPGNSGPVNGGIQPPTITTAHNGGMSGTAEPGATIRILQAWRADDPTDGITEPYSEGWTLPTSPAKTTAGPDGNWSLAFDEGLPAGQKLTASQTTAAGSSEYAPLRVATEAPALPIATITGGPSGWVNETTATFTFTTPTPGATLECGLDGAPFGPCTSPATFGPLEPGGHQFRVQARLGDKVSLPATRNWTINAQPPAPAPAAPAPAPAPTAKKKSSKPKTATAAQIFKSMARGMPSTKRCVSRRLLRLRLRNPKGARIILAQFRIRNKRTKTVSGRFLKYKINLRNLRKGHGKVRVRVRVVLSTGRVINASRVYRTCKGKKSKKKSKKKSSKKR